MRVARLRPSLLVATVIVGTSLLQGCSDGQQVACDSAVQRSQDAYARWNFESNALQEMREVGEASQSELDAQEARERMELATAERAADDASRICSG